MRGLCGAWVARVALTLAIVFVVLGPTPRALEPLSTPRSTPAATALRAKYIAARQAEARATPARDAAGGAPG
jgi:hypothetical protein